MKRKILEDFKKDRESNTLILGDFNTPVSTMYRSSKQNLNKDIVALNNVLDQMDLTNIYIYTHTHTYIYIYAHTHTYIYIYI